jgi:predicted O-methyltransferase YrrM
LKDHFFSIRAYLTYWLDKEDRYSQQSPQVFELYSGLLSFLKENKEGNPEIEKFRCSLLGDRTAIQVLDLGAGSKKVPQSIRPIASITRYSTSGSKFAQLYQYFCSLTPSQNVLEFGTCVGISTRYLSQTTKGKLYTFEGSPEIQQVAMRSPLPERTEFILGPIDQTLPKVLQPLPNFDFGLIDANHTYKGTLQIFDSLLPKVHTKTILAIGDIHWTPDMEQAWSEIKDHPSVRLTMDFFECGVVFFDFPGEKSHLVLDI